jgi:HEAT repeat protein
MHDIVVVVVRATIAALLLLTTVLFLTSIIRRAYQERKYRKLDDLRTVFDKRIREALDSRATPGTHSELTARPGSDAWQAIEDILLRLINEERYRDEVQKLCSALGYVSFYEKHLETRSAQVRALSIDKLGRMKSGASVQKLIALLDDKNPEIVSGAIRSLGKMGGPEALYAIVGKLPDLLDRSIVTPKAMGMALQSYGADAIPSLIAQKTGQDKLWVISCILDFLSRLPADPRSVHLAVGYLSSANVEVRSKALKVLGGAKNINTGQDLPELVLPLLRDPVWFVRLQAIRSLRALKYEAATPLIGKLIFDQSWQVRNEAAQALTVFGEHSLDIFLDILTGSDRYAKDSICEEIEKTNFPDQLIKNLKTGDRVLQKKSRQVLELMHSLGFSTWLHEYLAREGAETEKELVRTMMKTGPAV